MPLCRGCKESFKQEGALQRYCKTCSIAEINKSKQPEVEVPLHNNVNRKPPRERKPRR